MSLRFYCEYCPDSFAQFKDLVNHFFTCHQPREVVCPAKADKTATKAAQIRFITDVAGYAGADSGCEAATNYLGHPSSCLKCPFPKCVLMKRGVGIARAKKFTRNDRIRELSSSGMKTKELIARFKVSERTIQRAVKKRGGL